MKATGKILISWLLALTLAVTSLPVMALADEDGAQTEEDAAQTILVSTQDGLLDAAASDGTILLDADITLSASLTIPEARSIVLDLNGYTLTTTGSGARKITNYGSLTIQSSKEGGTLTNSDPGSYGLIDNYGTLTVESGTFRDQAAGDGASLKNREGGRMEINGGLFRSTASAYGNACVASDGVLTIHRGDFQSNSTGAYCVIAFSGALSMTAHSPGDVVVAGTHGGIGISGGEAVLTGVEASGENFYALWITNSHDAAHVTVDGGSYTGGKYGLFSTVDDSGIEEGPVEIRVADGRFQGSVGAAALGSRLSSNPWTLTLTGGTFSSDPGSYVPETGCMISQEGGWYTVAALGEETAAAKIGTTYYATLQEALEAAHKGDTVTMLRDAVMDGSQLGNTQGVLTFMQDLILDGGGHELRVTGISADAGSSPNLINIEKGARLTLRNLTLNGSGQAKNGVNVYASSAVLENVTVENCRWYAVVCNGSSLDISSLTTRGNQWGINVDNLSGAPSRFVMRAGTISEAVSVFFQASNPGVTALTTGVISGGTYGQVGCLPGTSGVSLSISGGTFSMDPSAYTASGCTVRDNEDGTWTVEQASTGGNGGGSSSGGGPSSGDSSSESTTQTHPDGSTTTTVTRPNGTVTETTKRPDGSSTVVETTSSGTVTQTHQTAGGVTGTTVTDASGAITEITVSVPSSVAADAAESGETVTLPVKVPTVSSSDAAPAVDISLPHSASGLRVEIPVGDITPGTVAVLVHADGTEEILKTSLPTDDGVTLTLDGSATVKILDNSLSFPDVHEAACWARDSIDFVTSRQLFNGTSSTTFTPQAFTSRAQLMTVLARLDGALDLSESASVQQGMAWAVETGLSDGSNPAAAITRQQLAAILYRYAGAPAVTSSRTFPDSDLVSDYAADAMAWAVETGIINGRADGKLDPTGYATRAQVAVMIQRYCFQMY